MKTEGIKPTELWAARRGRNLMRGTLTAVELPEGEAITPRPRGLDRWRWVEMEWQGEERRVRGVGWACITSGSTVYEAHMPMLPKFVRWIKRGGGVPPQEAWGFGRSKRCACFMLLRGQLISEDPEKGLRIAAATVYEALTGLTDQPMMETALLFGDKDLFKAVVEVAVSAVADCERDLDELRKVEAKARTNFGLEKTGDYEIGSLREFIRGCAERDVAHPWVIKALHVIASTLEKHEKGLKDLSGAAKLARNLERY